MEKSAPPTSVEHILPGGIGTYSISHISYFNHQKVPKPEGSMFTVAQTSSTDRNDENSNCSSYTGSGFTLWEESALKKGKTGKENMGENPVVKGKVVLNLISVFPFSIVWLSYPTFSCSMQFRTHVANNSVLNVLKKPSIVLSLVLIFF